MSLNKVTLIGNLGADPEIKSLQNGSKVANLRLATAERWRDKTTGERKEKTEWHRLIVWNENLVKIIDQYLRKGSKVYVEGKIETRKWTDQSGVEKYSTEIVIKGFDGKILMLDGRSGGSRDSGDGDDEYGSHGGGERSPSGGGARRPARNSDMDDEIPF